MKLNDSCDMDTLAAMLRFHELITQMALNGWQIFILLDNNHTSSLLSTSFTFIIARRSSRFDTGSSHLYTVHPYYTRELEIISAR